MKRSDLKELIKKSMQEVAPEKSDKKTPKGASGKMTPEEEDILAKYAQEKRDQSRIPSNVHPAIPMRENNSLPDDIQELPDGDGEEDVIAEAERIVAEYTKKQTLNEEMHGGYLELFEMNPNFEKGVANLLQAWKEWKEGPETEPEMIEEAKHDILAYLSSMMK